MREEINEVVAFLQNPNAFQEMGARAPRVSHFILYEAINIICHCSLVGVQDNCGVTCLFFAP